jgi:hypothetical protein
MRQIWIYTVIVLLYTWGPGVHKFLSVFVFFVNKQGDSGSPLVDEAGVQHGIASFMLNTCPPATPGGYTQVSYHLDWIKDNSDEYLKQKSLSDCFSPLNSKC